MYSKWILSLYVACLAVFFLALPAFSATGPDEITGVWLNEEKDANIEIYKCADKYCGKLVWLLNPLYPADSKEGAPGTPKLDHNNPDKELRKTPLQGLEIVKGMTFARGNKWEDGTVYDPKNGKTYSAKLTLVDAENLDLRGFIGISLFGRTSHWTRKH